LEIAGQKVVMFLFLNIVSADLPWSTPGEQVFWQTSMERSVKREEQTQIFQKLLLRFNSDMFVLKITFGKKE